MRLVLLVDWDPIGVFGWSGAMDEYDRYAQDICDLIEAGGTHEMLVEHLKKIAGQRMEMPVTTHTQNEVAAKLLAVYKNMQFIKDMQKEQ